MTRKKITIIFIVTNMFTAIIFSMISRGNSRLDILRSQELTTPEALKCYRVLK